MLRLWLKPTRTEIKRRFGSDFDLFCRLLAATSPIAGIKDNTASACRLYRQYHLDGFISRSGLITTHYVSVMKFLQCQTPERDTMGRKVWSLYQNLIGNEEVLPIDRWILRYFGLPADTRLYTGLYDDLESCMIALSRQCLCRITPGEYQCHIWCMMRGEWTTYGDILRQQDIRRENLLRRLL